MQTSPDIGVLIGQATTGITVMCRHDPVGTFRMSGRPGSGVRYRVLVPDTTRVTPVLARQVVELAAAGAVVRTLAHVPADSMVIDGRITIVPTGGTSLAAFTLPAVVSTAAELFDQVWPRAMPLLPDDPPASPALTVRQHDVLTLLGQGHTDDSAAAQLRVSVRTVRRTVAEIMARLGARSRFQAGVIAADRGWLLAESSPSVG
nr:LuxR C-terminal-related transcriptional regulator [Kibdelosporangium sp. MJ126-NF4]CEL13612.1 putative regulatory protein [Kibdelosporangium sp. MJ126-NF4]CTQ99298.1 putative regulatory protein [Kibdelosporangium sp. MJ126-NF4]